jgi:hypothetical protein
MADPITPPPELIEQWMSAHSTTYDIARQAALWGADQQLKLDAEQIGKAYQAGADQELEACCAELSKNVLNGVFYVGKGSCPSWSHFALKAINKLRDVRRPNPRILKKQALEIIDDSIEDGPGRVVFALEEIKTIRRALAALPDD